MLRGCGAAAGPGHDGDGAVRSDGSTSGPASPNGRVRAFVRAHAPARRYPGHVLRRGRWLSVVGRAVVVGLATALVPWLALTPGLYCTAMAPGGDALGCIGFYALAIIAVPPLALVVGWVGAWIVRLPRPWLIGLACLLGWLLGGFVSTRLVDVHWPLWDYVAVASAGPLVASPLAALLSTTAGPRSARGGVSRTQLRGPK